MEPTTPNKTLRINKFILIFAVIAAGVLAYIFLFPPKVIIINRSNTYKLTYTTSEDFNTFLNDLNELTNSYSKKKNSFKGVKITVVDKVIPKYVLPLYMGLNKTTDNGLLEIELSIDSALTESYTEEELDTLTLNLIISRLYVMANPGGDANKADKINEYANNIKNNKGSPFKLNLYGEN